MFGRRAATRRIAACLVFIAVAFTLAGSPSAIARVPEDSPVDPISIGVTVRLCTDTACASRDEAVIGVEVSAIDANTGEVFDTCVTVAANQIQGCGLEIPGGSPWDLTWDDARIPTVHEPFGDILHPTDGPGPHPYIIAYVPASSIDPTPEPVTILPSTGSGATGSGRTGPAIALFTLSAIAVAASAAGLVRRGK